MLAKPPPPRIPLPKGWQGCVKSAGLHAVALAHCAIVYARAWAADGINARVRLAADNNRLRNEDGPSTPANGGQFPEWREANFRWTRTQVNKGGRSLIEAQVQLWG